MTAYIIASLTIHDREEMRKYTAKVPEAIKQYEGRYLCRGAEAAVLEGEFPLKSVTILEFPSREVAERFWASPEYKECKALRENCSSGRVALVEGSPGEAPVPGYLRTA